MNTLQQDIELHLQSIGKEITANFLDRQTAINMAQQCFLMGVSLAQSHLNGALYSLATNPIIHIHCNEKTINAINGFIGDLKEIRDTKVTVPASSEPDEYSPF